MVDRAGRDRIRATGSILVGLGVSMWLVYAAGRYLLGWDITDRQFLPYHLATILPGMVLRYHHFFFRDLPARFGAGREKKAERHCKHPGDSRDSFLKIAVIVNNFVHDLFTGLWASSLLVIYLLRLKALSAEQTDMVAVLQDIIRTFFWLGILSIMVILASGGLRMLYYRAESGEDEKIKKELLIVKHVLFAFVFVGGTYFAYLHAYQAG